MNVMTEIKLYDADSFEYSGSIAIDRNSRWEFQNVTDEKILSIANGLPLKGVLQMLIAINIVYDIIPLTHDTVGQDSQ